METFLGMEVEQPGKVIKLHLASYIQEVQGVYQEITSSKACSHVPWIPRPLGLSSYS